MKPTRITIFEGLPGSGKTSRMLSEMICGPGRYILAAPRTALIEEHVSSLRSHAAQSNAQPTITSIHSDQDEAGPIKRRIADAFRFLKDAQHVILAITHEGLQSIDPAELEGWHVRIDETPDAVASGQIRAPVAARWFETLYHLIKVEGTKWCKVQAKTDAPSIGHFLRDDLAEQLAAFHKRVISVSGLYVDVGAWDEAFDRSKPIRWWSLWTPRDLAECASVKIAASGYASSLCALATDSLFPGEVEYSCEWIESPRSGQPKVHIHYITGHRGSTEFWKNGDGRDCLNAVGLYLSKLHDLGFWSGNEVVRDRFELLLKGKQVSPRQAGTNAYRHLRSCAIIYSNKAQDADSAILEVFGLTKDQIARAREIEDIQQFVMRGAIRNPDFDGLYDIYVYDLWQAEAVRDFLEDGGITGVTLLGIDEAGLMEFERPKGGRKPVQLDDRSKAERLAERRNKDAARKRQARSIERLRREEAGTLREPGRPPKKVTTLRAG
ncbi:hypothetical protein FNL56_09110 [Tardiphaga sp. vice304]|uniref:hypothetical protein n=1 Tax=Tardiphaga sp. vice304 TaxID=2592817 RepID=UPI00116216CB|nr:hypothetical protein [Tardiphaga sp. vice304]QDM26225.1 hypothetical protein FNL56_09110 [Tardiphaga sp. vice304]